MPETIIVRPSLKKHLLSFIQTIIITLIIISLLVYFNKYEKFIIIPGLLIIVSMFLQVFFKVYEIFKTTITLSKTALEFKYGVFNKVTESIEMHRIKDFVEKSSFIEQLFGLATVEIYSTDQTTSKIIFKGLESIDARDIIKFLQINSSDSIVKHFVNKEDDDKNKSSRKDQFMAEVVGSTQKMKKLREMQKADTLNIDTEDLKKMANSKLLEP